MARLVLTTTIYPGVEPFLADWYASVAAQDDQDFDLWIGLDGVGEAAAIEAMGADPRARWVHAEPGDGVGTVRQRVWERFDDAIEGVVFVDADDRLHPSRVGAAREGLRRADHLACVLRLVDRRGADLGKRFPPTIPDAPDFGLPRHNVFGLSNSATRLSTLRRCLPIPDELKVVDWFLASQAWLSGARLDYDRSERMDYRQHDSNLTQVLGPFGAERVQTDTERVRAHFRLLEQNPREGRIDARSAAARAVAADVEAFHRRVVSDPERLHAYVEALAGLDFEPLWWSCVAHPALAHLWRDGDTPKGILR